MGVLVYVLGRTGTGKSYSMRNFPKKDLAVLNVQGKILPFRDSAEIEQTNTDDYEKIVEGLEIYAKSYKSIVVDDFQYLMANEFMRRAYENGWDKFTEIGRHAWDIADKVRELPPDVIVYVMCHTDTDAEGTERLKTIGKLLDEKIFLEGMSTIVLKTHVADGKYSFLTQNNGKDTVKSPADMFPSYAIENDLYYVDQKIREYYGLGATLSADDLAKADETVAHTDVEKGTKKRRGRAAAKKAEETEEKPKRGRGRRRSDDPEVKAAEERNSEKIAYNGIDEDDPREEIPLDEVESPELEELPKRKKRGRAKANESANASTEEPQEVQDESEDDKAEEPKPTTRRRRRRA